MDSTTKGNLFIFLGSVLVLAAFWLIVLGAQDGSPLRIALGVCAGATAIAVFRAYARVRR